MPSSYSTSLRTELPANGEQTGTWGNTTNRNIGTLLEQGITGITTVDITTGDLSLTALNGAVDEARSAMLVISGTPSGATTITVPNVDKLYRVRNTTTVKVTFETSGGTAYECAAQSYSLIEVRATGMGVVTGVTITDAMADVLAADSLAASITAMGAAPLNSPSFTGTPTAPTAAVGTSTTQVATTAFVLANGVPSGSIIMWSGSVASIPSGWFLCDGNNSTPNLQDRFVIGAGNTYAVGATGGSKDAVVVSHSHSGSAASGGSHSHTGSTTTNGDHSHTIYNGLFGGSTNSMASDERNYGTLSVVYNTSTAGAHNHTLSIASGGAHTHSLTINSAGSSGTNANLPPYYALCFIMKA